MMIVLFGGFDQGVALPSLGSMVGMRTANGTDRHRPNVSATASRSQSLQDDTARRLPERSRNVAVVPSKSGMRISFSWLQHAKVVIHAGK